MIEQRSPLRQRRDLSEILQASVRLYSQFFLSFFSIAAVTIPLGIAAGIFADGLGNGPQGVGIMLLLGVAQLAVSQIVAAALLVALTDMEQGKTPEFGHSYDVALPRAITVLGASLRVAFHVGLFCITIVGIPWGVQRAIRWSFTRQAVMLEGADWKDALSTSATVVEGNWWRTLGCLTAIGIPSVVINIVSLTFPSNPIAVTSAAIAGLSALVVPFSVIAGTMLYFDLKERKEAPAPTEPPPPEEEIS